MWVGGDIDVLQVTARLSVWPERRFLRVALHDIL